MTALTKLKQPKKILPRPRKPKDTPKDVWVYQWRWELDPKKKTSEINKLKREIIKYCKEKLSNFNKKSGTSYIVHPQWDRIKKGSPKVLSVKLILEPAPPPGDGGLTPPTPPQPPPPSFK